MTSKRRPYLSGKASLVEFFDAPVRHLKDLTTVESAFEKPYLDEDYRKMHFDMPWPDWPEDPSWPHWPFYPGDPVVPFDPMDPSNDPSGPIPRSSACAIVCYEPLDCDDPIWCHPGIWCGADFYCVTCTWAVEGNVLSWEMADRPGGGIDVWIDDTTLEDGKTALISVHMTDPCGNICGELMEITCTVCPPDVDISWDEISSDETIPQGVGAGYGTAEVFVKDGLGLFSWSVSGTGFSFATGTTSAKQNTLRADNTACGTAIITVTDACDGVAIGYVRCEVGQWSEISWDSCVISGAITEGDDMTRIQGRYKLVEQLIGICASGGGGCTVQGSSLCFVYGTDCHCTNTALGCHSTRGCSDYCLDHAGGICPTTHPTECWAGNCHCCTELNPGNCYATSGNATATMCVRNTSKLYAWVC